MIDQEKLAQLWQQVNAILRNGAINRSLWDAAAAAKPLTIEDNVFVLGLPPKDMRHAGYLETMVNKTRIQEIIQARTGQRFDLRIIEGDTLEAWERVKERDRAAVARAEAAVDTAKAHHTSIRAWEDLNERLVKLFSTTSARRFPSNIARLLVQALPMVLETDNQVRTTDPGGEEIHHREINRIFDKLGTYCEIPPTMVAVEYLRFRARNK